MTTSNKEYELGLLGDLLKDAEHSTSREALDSLSDNDFSEPVHQAIFDVIKQMSSAKEAIGVSTVSDKLDRLGLDYPGLGWLYELSKNSFTRGLTASYVTGIKDAATLRDLLAAMNAANNLIGGVTPSVEIIEQLSNELTDISTSSAGKDVLHISDISEQWIDQLEINCQSPGSITGVATGIPEIDNQTYGFDRNGLIVIAGLPSMGKTLFAQEIMAHLSIEKGLNTMFFSMEMTKKQVMDRYVSMIGNIDHMKMKSGNLDNADWGRISEAVSRIKNSGLHVSDESSLSVGQIRAQARRHKAKHGHIEVIMIDYLGLMNHGKADREDIALGNTTRGLKELSKELNCPVVILAQANRGSYTGRPNMSNLKGSSCIEADADLVMFVHREEVIDHDTCLKGITEIITAKDRHGSSNGTVHLSRPNGRYVGLSAEQAGQMVLDEENRLNPPKKKKSRDF